jgi:hypothetical protein
MALNFPNSPSLNDTYTFNRKTWTWDGTAWKVRFITNRTDGGAAASVYTVEQNIDGGSANG